MTGKSVSHEPRTPQPDAKTSPKAKPRKAALKAAKTAVSGLRPTTRVARDTASAKERTAALKGRSQNNFRG